MNQTTPLNIAIGQMPTITLEDMGKVKLMNRVDTKYIMLEEDLVQMLVQMKERYCVQVVSGNSVSPYKTLYLDTAEADMFLVHHNGRKAREKIRIRSYADSGIQFLEVKDKSNKGRTRKKRMMIPEHAYNPDAEVRAFLEEYALYPPDSISPHVETMYDRITLVNRDRTERLTIDINLRFRNLRTEVSKEAPGLVIMELKQDANQPSFAKELLLEKRIKSTGLSKYCIGAVLTDPSLKMNRFKPKVHQINKLIYNYSR